MGVTCGRRTRDLGRAFTRLLAALAAVVLIGALTALVRPAPASAGGGGGGGVAPANDDFAAAEPIAGDQGSAKGSTVGATAEPGEPFAIDGSTVWYRWVAPADGPTTFTTQGSTFDTTLGVYVGSSVDKLDVVGFNDDSPGTFTSAVTFDAKAGTEYEVQVGSFGGQVGDLTLSWFPAGVAARPANDDFASAAPIAGPSGQVTGTNQAATVEPGEPAHAGTGGASVWYRWTAPADGPVRFRTAGSDYDTVLAVYVGDAVDKLTLVASNDDTSGGGSQVDFEAAAGTVYSIAVDGFFGATGSIVLTWVGGGGPPNDAFVAAQPIGGADGSVTGTTDGATTETGEPFIAVDAGGHTIWYRWTPTETGVVTFDTTGSAFNTAAAVFTGVSVDRLTPVALGVDSPTKPFTSTTARFLAFAGTDYFVAVDSYRDSTGALNLAWSTLPRPANDDIAAAEPLSGPDGQVTGSNLGATPELLDPPFLGQASIWYRWTAPADGAVSFSTAGSGFDTTLAVYTEGKDKSDLQRVGANDNVNGFGGPTSSEVDFVAAGGTDYLVQVDGSLICGTPCGLTPMGDVVLTWAAIPVPANDDLAAAQVIGGDRGTLVGRNFGATHEPGEPDHAGQPGSNSVWYRWTAASTNRTRFEADSGFGAVLAVYTPGPSGGVGDLVAVGGAGPGVLDRVAFDAVAGHDYLVAVDGATSSFSGQVGRFTLDWRPVPANDDFAHAAVITGGSGTVHTSNVDASREVDEPDHAGRIAARSLWFDWTADADGPVVFYTHGSTPDTVLDAWTGDSLDALTLVAANDDEGRVAASEIRFDAKAGTTYHLAVDTLAGHEGGLVLSWAPPPANDAFADAEVIAGPTGSVTGSTHGATSELGEPSPALGASIWYRWTAPATGLFTFVPSSPDFVTADFLAGDAVGALQPAHTLSGPAAGPNRIVVANAGDVVYVRFAGTRSNALPTTAVVGLTWAPLAAPANDDLGGATPISGPSGQTDVLTTGATAEPGEPDHGGHAANASVWFAWTAPSDGRFTFETQAADFDTSLSVYTGKDGGGVGGLTPVADNDDADGTPGPLSRVRVTATAGTTYLIAVDGPTGFGRARLAWDPTPANDDAADPLDVAGTVGRVTSALRGGSREPGEPEHGSNGTASVWFRWTAPVDGAVSFIADGGIASDLATAAYTGTAVDHLTAAPGQANHAEFVVDATAGTTYLVAVQGTTRHSDGSVDLDWLLEPRPGNDNFNAAQVIGGPTGTVDGRTTLASHEPGEPAHAGLTGSGSVWYVWTAPASGKFAFFTGGGDTVLAAYAGSSLDKLTPLDAQDDQPGLGKNFHCPDCNNTQPFDEAKGSAVVVDVAAGDEIHLAVDGQPSDFRLHWAPVPANDDLAAATPISGADGQIAGTTDGATLVAGDPITLDADTSEAASHAVWYRWTAPADANVSFVADNSGIGAKAFVVEGTDYSNFQTPEPRRIGFDAKAGHEYRIVVVSGFSRAGPFTLHWRTLPANDDQLFATDLTGSAGSITGSNVGATLEPGEPPRSDVSVGSTVWYRWTAPADGVYRVRVTGQGYPATFEVYGTGDDKGGGGLKGVEPLPEFGNEGPDHVVFSALAGQAFLVRVGGVGTATGSFTLAWDAPAPYVAVGDVFPQAENDPSGSAGFLVFLSWPSTGSLRVGYSTVDGTAKAPADYAATAGTLVIPPGESSGVISVPIVNDSIDEDDETFDLRLVDPVDGVVTRAEGTATILDDDAPPTVSVGDARAPEGDSGVSSAGVPVTLSGPSGKRITVQFATSPGTAAAGADYTTTSGTAAFDPGQTSATIRVPITADVAIEGDETFTLGLSSPVSATLGRATGTVTIADDDGPPVLGPVSVTGPVAVGGSVTLGASFTDADQPDPHTAVVSWGDGTTSPATVTPTATGGTVSAAHSYAGPGVYAVRLQVDDSGGGRATGTARAVVFDPNGAITGGGSVGPPRADFSASIHYAKGATHPTGSVVVGSGTSAFVSTGFDWLVVNGSSARAEGVGTVGGRSGFAFSLSALDGRPDRVRVRVWEVATGRVVYDNEPAAALDAPPTAPMPNGNVVVH